MNKRKRFYHKAVHFQNDIQIVKIHYVAYLTLNMRTSRIRPQHLLSVNESTPVSRSLGAVFNKMYIKSIAS